MSLSIIGHGGSSAYRPENSPSALALAIDQGAHGLWLRVAPTQDRRLAVVSEIDLSECTSVRKQVEFASRFGAKKVLSQQVRGWFTVDFTADELSRLSYAEPRARLRKESAQMAVTAPESISTLAEHIDALGTAPKGTELWIEFLLPGQCAEWDLKYTDLVLTELELVSRKVSMANLVFVSAEKSLIRELRMLQTGARLFYRTEAFGYANDEATSKRNSPRTYANELTPDGLHDLAQLCDGIVVDVQQAFSQTGAERTAFEILWQNTNLIEFAHAAGLQIAGAGLRAENKYRPQYLRSGVDPAGISQAHDYFELAVARGFDALVTDHPDLLTRVV